jgi:hypothetical protein
MVHATSAAASVGVPLSSLEGTSLSVPLASAEAAAVGAHVIAALVVAVRGGTAVARLGELVRHS